MVTGSVNQCCDEHEASRAAIENDIAYIVTEPTKSVYNNTSAAMPLTQFNEALYRHSDLFVKTIQIEDPETLLRAMGVADIASLENSLRTCGLAYVLGTLSVRTTPIMEKRQSMERHCNVLRQLI